MKDDPALSDRSTATSGRHYPPASRRKRYGLVAALLALALVAGFAIGFSVAAIHFNHKRKERPTPEAIARNLTGKMRQDVALSAEEEATVADLLRRGFEEVETIRLASMNEVWDKLDAMDEAVDSILGPERAQKWEAAKERHFGPRRHRPARLRPGTRQRDRNGGGHH
ncbi:MAG: hypothetical protein LIP77_04200 [Planctomycetes bacterium]|nr:hypothetical protein [Planctomycetota bacterium]